MKAHLWGVRGSLPASYSADLTRRKIEQALSIAAEVGLPPDTDIRAFVDKHLDFSICGSYGTNTSCVQIDADGDDIVICDSGSGLRDLGQALMQEKGPAGHRIHILISHPHWDHIQGFPFFSPAFVPGNHITIYGGHENLAEIFEQQMEAPCFPVPLSTMAADIDFVQLTPGQDVALGDLNVSIFEQNHPGKSFGYRFDHGGSAIVYSTDSEHQDVPEENAAFVKFIEEADLLIFDAQYEFAEAAYLKEGWGHSSNLVGVELAKDARVKTLCIFHLEPTLDDEMLSTFLDDTRQYAEFAKGGPLEVIMAYDGLEVSV